MKPDTPFTTLIQPDELQALLDAGAPLLVLDCSFDLMNPAAGRAQFETEHVAGSLHVDLDRDLSEHGLPASEGRHPLPQREAFARRMATLGLSRDMQVVVLDRQGVNYCGRLWWMLRWCGHAAVAVLDEIRAGIPSHVSADLNARPLLSADELRERMSGNICRCGAYSNIVEAITEVAGGQS